VLKLFRTMLQREQGMKVLRAMSQREDTSRIVVRNAAKSGQPLLIVACDVVEVDRRCC